MMKKLTISILSVLFLMIGWSSSAQQKAELASNPEKSEIAKKDQKPSIWDLIPADGFVPTGNEELDKKRKMEIQTKWAKENPKKFQKLLEENGIKKKKPKIE